MENGAGHFSEIAARAPAFARRPAAIAPGPPPRTGALRVLLVEDDPDQIRLLGHLIGTQIRLASVSTLATGLQALAADAFDAVLLDLTLTDSSGYQTFHAIREAAPEVALLVLSGLPDEPLALRVVQEGAQDYFVKGEIEGAALIRAIRHAVERMRLERAHARAELALRTSEERLRALAARIDEVREAERARIARELHDQVGQFLTGLRMDIAWISGHYSAAHPPLAEKTRDMLELVDSSISLVRSLCADLRPRLLDDLGLPTAIEWQVDQFQRRTGIACEFARCGTAELDGVRALSVFRILQEALTNILRHAGAQKVEINLDSSGEFFELEIADDGRGADAERFSCATSLGVLGMKERAQACDGVLEIESAPGRGTVVVVRLPLIKHPIS